MTSIKDKEHHFPLFIDCGSAMQLLYSMKQADNITKIHLVLIKKVLTICGHFTHLPLLTHVPYNLFIAFSSPLLHFHCIEIDEEIVKN